MRAQNHWLLTVILELQKLYGKFSLEIVLSLREVVKKDYFSVRLTLRVELLPRHSSYGQLFVNFFGASKKHVFFGPNSLFQPLFSGSKFSHLLTVRAEGAELPPHGQPDRYISVFWRPPLYSGQNICNTWATVLSMFYFQTIQNLTWSRNPGEGGQSCKKWGPYSE